MTVPDQPPPAPSAPPPLPRPSVLGRLRSLLAEEKNSYTTEATMFEGGTSLLRQF